MASRVIRLIVSLIALQLFLSASVSQAQTPSPEALAAAKELVATMHLNDQYNALVPTIVKNLKPIIVQGRADVERQYDVLAPGMIDAFRQRVSEMSEAAAFIYAKNFSPDDIHAFNEFYKTPAGQRLLEKMPSVAAESLATGQKLGRAIGGEVQQRMIEELRKKGVNL
jgi:uncharacterized protein